jgi:hypothetical protein
VSDLNEGTRIESKDGLLVGTMSSEAYNVACETEGCRHDMARVEWDDGDVTWICLGALEVGSNGLWRIL